MRIRSMSYNTLWTNAIFRACDIVVVYLWAVIHDRPTSWACERRNWNGIEVVRLPSQPTMSRRLRTRPVQQLLDQVEAQLGGLNQEAVEAKFMALQRAVERCLGEGSERVSDLGGTFDIAVRIRHDGSLRWAFMAASTLRFSRRIVVIAMRAKPRTRLRP